MTRAPSRSAGEESVTVSVIGAGKMGLPLACAFASRGARVIACDVNQQIVDAVNAGRPPFEEPGVGDLLADAVASGRLRATRDNRGAIAQSDVVVVIVPVLLTPEHAADVRIIEAIADDCAASVRRGAMVVFETTLPLGTTRRLGARIERGGLRAGEDFDLVFSPERVKSQLVLKHLFDIPKVVGGLTPAGAARAEAFYARYLGAPVRNVGTLEAAELVKLAGMVYRDVNIALANELARYAEAHGLDFGAVREAANTDGEAALLIPGIGVGGHCTPVYPHFLINEARARGLEVPLTAGARAYNDGQPARVLDRLGDVAGKRALILGVSFRPQVKETAYSPALALRDELERRGALVRAWDPLYTDEELRRLGFEPGAPEGHELLVLNTAHDAFRALDFSALALGGAETVLDGRNLWSPEVVRGAGLRYVGIGRPDVEELASASGGR